MILRPAGRFLTIPFPPRPFAARRFAAVILPPLLFFAICHHHPSSVRLFLLKYPMLGGRHCNGAGLYSHRSRPTARPGKQSASHRGAVIHRDADSSQDVSLEAAGRTKSRGTADLPEDVFRLGAAAQDNTGTGTHGERGRHLEDEDRIRVTLGVES